MIACISLKEKGKVDGEIGLTAIERGRFIVGHFEIQINEFEKSWSCLFIWMSENGYKKLIEILMKFIIMISISIRKK